MLYQWSTVDVLDSVGTTLVTMNPDLYEEVNEVWFYCSNPTNVTISNWSYSTLQDLWNGILYVSWACQANGITVTLACVIDTNTWRVFSNAEAESIYNRQSTITHWAWDVLAIWSWNIQGWAGEIIVCWDIMFTPQGNLWIALSGVSQVNAWSNGVLTITITNNWPDSTEDTVVQGTLPAWVNYVSDDSDGQDVWQEITWELWTLISWQVVVINLTLEFATGGSKALTFGVWSTTTDPTPWNDTATRNVTSLQGDLAITLSGATSAPALGNFIQTVTVNNNWPTLVNGAIITIIFPIGIGLMATQAWTYDAGTRTLTWNRWTIDNWVNPQMNITLYSSTVASYDILGAVTATTPDWNPANNNTTRTIAITKASFDLQVLQPVNNFSWNFYSWVNGSGANALITNINKDVDFLSTFRVLWNPSSIFWAVTWLTIEIDYPEGFTYNEAQTSLSIDWIMVFVSDDTVNRILTFTPASDWNAFGSNREFWIVGNVDTAWAVTFTCRAILDSAVYEDYNLSNNTRTTGITITEPPVPIEIRVSNASFSALDPFDLENIALVYIIIGSTNYTSSFTLDAWDISWTSFRLGYFTWPAGGIEPYNFGFQLYWMDYYLTEEDYYSQVDPTTFAVLQE